MRDSNIGNELKDVAHEVMRFGERCVQAGRTWLNERRDEMNNRNNEDRGDYGSGQRGQHSEQTRSDGPSARYAGARQGSGQGASSQQYSNQQYSNPQYSSPDYSESEVSDQNLRGGRGQPMNRNRGEYYGGAQFNERSQSAGWDQDGGSEWSYEGGPERFGSSGYSEGNLRASGAYQGEYSQSNRQNVQQYGRQAYGQGRGQENYGMQRGQYGREQSGASDYYGGRQGFGSQAGYGSEYNTYGRNQGYGEASGYTRQQNFGPRGTSGIGRNPQGGSFYGGESSGSGGRGPLYASQDYQDEGEMSGYRGGRELGTQEIGSRASGRYGTEPGQYGYGGYGLGTRGYRGVGPKNYMRSDERLMEEINERLTDDDDLDASDISVRVADCKVTLEGTVDQRWMKHRAEDIADACSGVKEVDNRITVSSASRDLGASSRAQSRTSGSRTTAGAASGTSATGATGTSTTGASTTGTQNPPGSIGTH
ncbi:BON domain-containing protein [Agrilutibacter solisilvae]|uniref:BON domain-containing protein n=1 Tax=Agrilutibacter solisilvae TaxID=2763317 RepID=A0A975ART5_9GAMM|nr:BON domain-containing protein [Lysobacter solisilvae]QSX77573.1 BON domain-containing protein [Lysobacter solisilvae]